MAKPILSSKTGTGAKLLQYAETVLAKTTENAGIFVEPRPSMDDLSAAIEQFRTSMTEASFRDMRQVVLKNQHATALKEILYNLSLYVETIAQGDPAIVLAAGFIPSKDMREPVGLSPKPYDVRAQVRDAGTRSVHVRVDTWKHARYYQFEFRKVGSAEAWTRILSTKSKVHITDLEYLNEYEFRVSYLGSNPALNYSEIVRCAVT
ncbi:hypothetical protein [Parapedobacter sp. 10938]|uniref:hypothetical protein n=1 Tax=Parapedobacter flavus TaxID=3110225 RepID=UPI002DB83C00|nr:hypothetical protein [Parapedobacter sp. 10938]MEC3880883.1 hypothetical protein [Parapedobacter sp. 10938]